MDDLSKRRITLKITERGIRSSLINKLHHAARLEECMIYRHNIYKYKLVVYVQSDIGIVPERLVEIFEKLLAEDQAR